jgi:hypothetical protein
MKPVRVILPALALTLVASAGPDVVPVPSGSAITTDGSIGTSPGVGVLDVLQTTDKCTHPTYYRDCARFCSSKTACYQCCARWHGNEPTYSKCRSACRDVWNAQIYVE